MTWTRASQRLVCRPRRGMGMKRGDAEADGASRAELRTPRAVRFFISVALVIGVVLAYRQPWPLSREHDRLLLEQTATGRWQHAPRRPERWPGPRRVLAVCVTEGRSSGFLRPMWFEGWAGLRLYPMNFSPTPEEGGAMRSAILDIYASHGDISLAAANELRTASMSSGQSVLWNGVLLAIGIVAGTIAAIVVMPWWWLFVEIPSDLWRSMTRHEDASRCRRCRYPLSGLPTRRCPECGLENAPDLWQPSHDAAGCVEAVDTSASEVRLQR